jgi:cation:H+ antiporter
VLGITAIVGAIGIDKSFYRLTWPVLMLFSIALYYFLWNDNQLVALEGLILFTGLIVFIVYLIRTQKSTDDLEEVDDALAVVSNFKIGIWLLIGAAALYFGSEWLVKGATQIATSLGVSEAVIGVTMIAIGTSVPELAASVIAAAKKEKAISLGNLIGSNIFNIGSVLGLTSMIKTIPVTEPLILSRDIFWMLIFASLVLILGLLPKRHEIGKIKGFGLVLLYGIFILLVFRG